MFDEYLDVAEQAIYLKRVAQKDEFVCYAESRKLSADSVSVLVYINGEPTLVSKETGLPV